MSLTEKLQQVVDDLSVIDDPQERLSLLVDRARRIPPFAPAERTDDRRVRGCVSLVWLSGEVRDGRCYFRSDADSPIVRGLVAFLCDFFSGVPAAEVAASELQPLDVLDLTRNLSPTRRNGLASAVATIRAFAQAQGSAGGTGP